MSEQVDVSVILSGGEKIPYKLRGTTLEDARRNAMRDAKEFRGKQAGDTNLGNHPEQDHLTIEEIRVSYQGELIWASGHVRSHKVVL